MSGPVLLTDDLEKLMARLDGGAILGVTAEIGTADGAKSRSPGADDIVVDNPEIKPGADNQLILKSDWILRNVLT